MAKRKRLIPSAYDPESAPDSPCPPEGEAPGARMPLRAALGAPPPIAQVTGDAATQAALDEVTEAMRRARAEGRLVLTLPLAAVDPGHLVRDRITLDEEDLGHLMDSIRSHGQRMPIEVADLGEGRADPRYGLISGWRRLQALQRLSRESGDARFGTVLALLRRPAEASEAYVAMVEENEVRQGLSYYERARIAARAVDLGVFTTEKQALQRLFSAASRARRSKIGSFLSLYRRLDGVLRFPAAIPERLGLALVKALEERPEAAEALMADLAANPAPDAGAEQARLARFVSGKGGQGARPPKAPPSPREMRPGLFLAMSGNSAQPALTLSGPAVDSGFRARLEAWLTSEA